MSRRRALVALLTLAPFFVGTGAAHADPNCNLIARSADAQTNLDSIQFCLDAVDYAYLAYNSSPFDIPAPVQVRDNDILTGDVGASIRMVATTPPGSVIHVVGSGALVYGLKIDAYQKLNYHGIIVRVERATSTSPPANNNTIRDNEIFGGAMGLAVGVHAASAGGPYTFSVACSTCSGNHFTHNNVHDDYIGVVFATDTTSAYPNYAENNWIHDMECDTVDLAGYGVFRDNTADNNGASCATAAGGAIYSADNLHGALIERNTVTRMCGHGIDLINGMGFVVDDQNIVRNPGVSTRDPSHTYCHGAAAMSMVNIRQSNVIGNTFETVDTPSNMRKYGPGSSAGFKDNTATAADYSDVPTGGNSVMAFLLVWTGNQTYTGRSNVINNNTMHAECSIDPSCRGIGIYLGRATGSYKDQSQDPASWNRLEGNVVWGSEYGSVRWGHGWWAGNNTDPTYTSNTYDYSIRYCDERSDGHPDACNDDDYHYNHVAGQTYPTLYRSMGKPTYTEPLL